MLTKKITTILIGVLIVGAVAGMLLFNSFKKTSPNNSQNKPATEQTPLSEDTEKVPEIMDVDLSLSPLKKAELPEINLDLSLDLENFALEEKMPSLELDSGDIKIEPPTVDVEISGNDLGNFNFSNGGGNPSNLPINSQTCQKFSNVPSCSYVSKHYQNLCQQCKDAGF